MELTSPAPYAVTGHLQLASENGRLILKTVLAERCTHEAAFFAAAIEEFFGQAKKMRELVR
jgi:hypothetical protein